MNNKMLTVKTLTVRQTLALLSIAAIVAGLTGFLLGSTDEPSTPDVGLLAASNADSAAAEPITGELDNDVSPSFTAEEQPDTAALIVALRDELAQQRVLSQSLRQDMERLQTDLVELQQRVAVIGANTRQRVALAAEDGAEADASADASSIGTSAFTAAGFNIGEAERLAQRWGEAEMEQLYLRDQALREGWFDTPRYRDAVDELRSNYSFVDELDSLAYDRFLFATGQPNRVSVSGIIEGSPAQLVGLQPGDKIVNYDGVAIRSGSDLRGAIGTGMVDELVSVEIDRGGQRVDIELPRGPIGIRLESISVAP